VPGLCPRRHLRWPSGSTEQTVSGLSALVSLTLIFTGSRGNAVRRSNFQKHWAAALAKAGLRGVHLHDLRHTGNTVTAHAGAALSDL